MTPEQFFDLDEMEQAEEIWEGTHVGNREDQEHNILLFKLDDLYVEVFVHKEYQVIRRFEAFTPIELLDIYKPVM